MARLDSTSPTTVEVLVVEVGEGVGVLPKLEACRLSEKVTGKRFQIWEKQGTCG